MYKGSDTSDESRMSEAAKFWQETIVWPPEGRQTSPSRAPCRGLGQIPPNRVWGGEAEQVS